MFTTSRSLLEYRLMFGLTPSDMESSLLDCGAGASSFAAEVTAKGGSVCAIDTLYRFGHESVIDAALTGLIVAKNNIVGDPRAYTWGEPFHSLIHHAVSRTVSVSRFLQDYGEQVAGRYVAASLSDLPFGSRSFDMVLSSHLLFTYASEISVEEHARQLLEMVRVAKREVRIYPIVGFGCDASNHVRECIEVLEHSGCQVTLVKSEYHFYKTADQYMRILVG